MHIQYYITYAVLYVVYARTKKNDKKREDVGAHCTHYHFCAFISFFFAYTEHTLCGNHKRKTTNELKHAQCELDQTK